jgi:hypothetical protein
VRTIRTLALLGVIGVVVVGVQATAAPVPGHVKQDDCKRLTAHEFRRWAQRVWPPKRWERKRLKKSTLAAYQRKLGCAVGTANRKAMRSMWERKKNRFRHHQYYCWSGPVTAGRVSVFGGGLTAGGYIADSTPGIALYQHETLGMMYRVRLDGHQAYMRHIDVGPAPWTGRAIDITFRGAELLGGVTTDHEAVAQMIPSGCY